MGRIGLGVLTRHMRDGDAGIGNVQIGHDATV
jgi:hypothetical protein